MSIIILSGAFAMALFFGVYASLRLGWKWGRQRYQRLGEAGQSGLGAVEGAVFGLMGLLIAFTFTGAANRFDHRRELIAQQVNAIGTAWLRLDLLNDSARVELRELLRNYLDAQLEMGRQASETEALMASRVRMTELQGKIWEKATAAAAHLPPAATPLVLSSLNDMFDIAESRWLATRQHPPAAVFLLLGMMILVSAVMAGFGMAKSEYQSRLHLWGFAAILAIAVYLILDLEYPRLGIVRVDSFDQSLIEMRAEMN